MTARIRQGRFGLWGLLVTALLLTSLVLGFLAGRRDVDPNLHGMFGFVAGVLALGSHVRRGGGWDFLGVGALVGAIGLGLMVQAGGVSADLHLALAVSAVVLSAGLHLRRLWVFVSGGAGPAARPSR